MLERASKGASNNLFVKHKPSKPDPSATLLGSPAGWAPCHRCLVQPATAVYTAAASGSRIQQLQRRRSSCPCRPPPLALLLARPRAAALRVLRHALQPARTKDRRRKGQGFSPAAPSLAAGAQQGSMRACRLSSAEPRGAMQEPAQESRFKQKSHAMEQAVSGWLTCTRPRRGWPGACGGHTGPGNPGNPWIPCASCAGTPRSPARRRLRAQQAKDIINPTHNRFAAPSHLTSEAPRQRSGGRPPQQRQPTPAAQRSRSVGARA